ncbi:lysosome membrane protein 2-like [Thrips palmi]|uniref:Scavenger receptor class B member 1 n=1 Tax=Thrips palmi TaxID=161013 RepID=A0A6P8YCC9_THRPL|nr:lysosome membrane protein 2-like [Thrips palmi]
MTACKKNTLDREASFIRQEKSPRWFFGKIRKPFLETLKKTDIQECRRSWLCCGREDEEPVEASPTGRCSLGDVANAKPGELEFISLEPQPRRRKTDGAPRWRGIAFLLAACLFCFSGSCIMWTTDAFHDFVANQMVLDANKGSFAWWVTPPINPWFRVYIWNYTNWDEYTRDRSIKIKLKEVGPFTYREVIRREAIEFDEKGITLSYREVKTYEFMPEMSATEDLNATVVVPNIPYFGAKAKVAGWGQGLFGTAGSVILNLSSRAFKLNPLISVTANGFIWGYDDNLFTLSKLDPTNKVPMDQVGLLTMKTIPDDLTILTGAADIDKLSYFVRFNHKSSLGAWSEPACNSFEGSDGSMFPPRKVRAKDTLYAYKPEACRLIKFIFQRKSFAQGVRAHRYILDQNTFMSPRVNPDNLCFCNQTDLQECPLDGIFDTSPCAHGAPMYISYPHFYLTDPAALEPFEGMHPDAKEHDMFADIHPRLGMTLSGRSRLQFNLRVVKETPHLDVGMVLPVAWFAQDLPSYDAGFKTIIIIASYALDFLEFVLLYVLPVAAVLTALVLARRLLLLARRSPYAAAPTSAENAVEHADERPEDGEQELAACA